MNTVEQVVRKYLGIPFVHRGRSLKGLDCWGVPILIYRDEVCEKIADKDYPVDWVERGLDFFSEIEYLNWVRVDKPFFPDLLLFKNAAGKIHHAGIYTNNNKFLHATKKGGVVQSRLEGYWLNQLEGAYRLSGGVVEDRKIHICNDEVIPANRTI